MYKNIFQNVIFREGNENDRNILDERFKECEFWEGSNDDPEDLLVLYYKNELIGIVRGIYETECCEKIFYVSNRCTVDKKHLPIFFKNMNGNKKFISPGRLLWIYILNYIYKLNNKNNNNRNFIVYNHAIPESYYYHIKMGMKPISKTLYDSNNIRKIFIENEELNTAELPDNEIINNNPFEGGSDKKLNIFDNTYLFYISNPNIDYNDLIQILYSLPGAKDIITKNDMLVYNGGKKKEKNKKKTKKKKNKKKTKNNKKIYLFIIL